MHSECSKVCYYGYYQVGARMSIPKLSNPKMSILMMSTVPKCLFPLCLLFKKHKLMKK